MSAPTASACTVVLNQQRELAVQHHERDKAVVAPCKAVSCNCTVVENGRVVVKPTQLETEASAEF